MSNFGTIFIQSFKQFFRPIVSVHTHSFMDMDINLTRSLEELVMDLNLIDAQEDNVSMLTT